MSEWTVETLKEHFEALIEEINKRYEQRFLSSENAIEKRDAATEKRFESVNEFRQTLADITSKGIPRVEFENTHKALSEKLEQAVKTLESEIASLRQQLNDIKVTVS